MDFVCALKFLKSVHPCIFYDTYMLISTIIGEDLTKVAGSSLANLANTVLGSPLSKKEQVSNW